MGVLDQRGGLFDAVEVHRQMDQQLVQKLYEIYCDYPEEWKKHVVRNIPTGQPVEFYVATMNILMLMCAWHEVSQIMLLSISIVNARIGYIIHLMSPQQRQRFCTMMNQIIKHDDGIRPDGTRKDNEISQDV